MCEKKFFGVCGMIKLCIWGLIKHGEKYWKRKKTLKQKSEEQKLRTNMIKMCNEKCHENMSQHTH